MNLNYLFNVDIHINGNKAANTEKNNEHYNGNLIISIIVDNNHC